MPQLAVAAGGRNWYTESRKMKKILRPIVWLALVAALAALVWGGVRLWYEVEDLVSPVLSPLNQAYAGYSKVPEKALGLRLEPLVFKGWDGGEMTAVIAEQEGEESSRQLSVIGDLAVNPADRLHRIDYVLVCVDWDHGIRSALPLAESLTAAGLRCVLWEPRGAGDRRPYCTHGLNESADVPLLIDALLAHSGKEKLTVIGVGQGYGAGLLLQAAAREPRLNGLVSIDAYASLRESIGRTLTPSPFNPLKIWLMDLKISSSVGFECFDVAPVESAARIDRNTPVLVMNLEQNNPVTTPKDALTIYRQLPSDCRDIRVLRSEADAADASCRRISYRVGKDNRAQEVCVEVPLLRDSDAAWTTLIHWLNDTLVESLETPHVLVPQRPNLESSTRL